MSETCPQGWEIPHRCPPRPAAPDVDTDTGALPDALREELALALIDHLGLDADETDWEQAYATIDALSPAFRDLIAERDQAVAAVELCPKCKGTGVMSRPPGIPADQPTWTSHTIGPYICNLCDGRMVLRRALDGDQ